jgi:hypothetical protein
MLQEENDLNRQHGKRKVSSFGMECGKRGVTSAFQSYLVPFFLSFSFRLHLKIFFYLPITLGKIYRISFSLLSFLSFLAACSTYMKAYICVDYLSHDWDSDDLIFAHSQARQQLSQTASLLSAPESFENPREQQRLVGERSRLRRFENALWRQISLRCTSALGSSNSKINPVSINW